MRARTVLPLALLVILAACGGGGTADLPDVTQTTSAFAPNRTSAATTSTTAADGMTLRYGYGDGEQLRYSFTQDIAQHMTLDVPELDVEAGIPGDRDTTMKRQGTVTVASSELDNGDTRISFSMQIEGVSGEMTAGEERIDLSDPALAGELTSIPLDYEVVINDRGEIVDLALGVDGESVDMTPWLELFGGDASGLIGGFGNEAMFGIPEFPDGEVQVGTSWEVENSQEMLGLVIESGAVYTVTDIEGDVVTIDTETSVGAFSMTSDDLLAMLSLMAEDQVSEASGAPITSEDLEQLFGLLQFEMQSEPTTGTGTLRFDVREGITVYSSTTMDQVLTMMMSIPDEASGRMLDMSMRMEQSTTFELTLEGDGSV